MINNKYYIEKIKEELVKRQKKNPNYSLRSFSRDLEIHPSTLSKIIKGNRSLPLKNAKTIVIKLALSPKEITLFNESLWSSKTNIDKIDIFSKEDDRVILDESHFKIIAEWEHAAVLTMLDLSDIKPTREALSKHLGITDYRIDIVLSNLVRSNLLVRQEDGTYIKTCINFRTTEDISSPALKHSHLETLEMGIKKIDETEIEIRDFSSMTIAVDPDKILEAKTIIREFRQKMSQLLRDGNKREVYQLAIQFYPLTCISKKNYQEKTRS